MSHYLPRVALLIESSRTYGRGILRGIARFTHANGPWSCLTQERELHSSIPDWLSSWKCDGIIARIEDGRVAKALRRVGCPIIDVLGNARFYGVPTVYSQRRTLEEFAPAVLDFVRADGVDWVLLYGL